MKGFGIQLVRRHHLGTVRRLLRLHNHPDRARGLFAIVNYQIIPALRIDVMFGIVIGLLQKIGHQILVELLRLGSVRPIQQLDQIRLEALDLLADRLHSQKSLIQRLSRFQWNRLHLRMTWCWRNIVWIGERREGPNLNALPKAHLPICVYQGLCCSTR